MAGPIRKPPSATPKPPSSQLGRRSRVRAFFTVVGNTFTDHVWPSIAAFVRFSIPVGLFIMNGLLLYNVLPTADRIALANATRILIALFAGLLPAIIYSYFIEGRLPVIEAEYKQNLRRLGFPENALLYQQKFDAVYGTETHKGKSNTDAAPELRPERGVSLFQSPVIVATLLSVVGWLLVFYPVRVASDTLGPNPETLAYGFLGAYVFGLGSLVRQYVTDDLQPRYYASLTHRYLTVFVLSWLVTLLTPKVIDGQPTPSDNFLLAAFVIGLFPTVGLRVAARLGTSILGVFSTSFKEDQPLSKLDGLNAFHEDRLLLEGIENLQSLSCARVVDLMLKTRYSVEQIVDWIDQALLHMHAGGRADDFRACGIRTATDLLDAYYPFGMPEEKLTTEQLEKLRTHREHIATLLDYYYDPKQHNDKPAEHTITQLATMALALRLDPNLFHIRYWRDHIYEALPEDVERKRTFADLKLMQKLWGEAIDAYDDLLRDFPNYHTARLYRGLAHFERGQYARAINDYSTVIEQAGPTWDGGRHAYIGRGRAWRELKEFDKAVENFNEALLIYDPFPEAHVELAFVLIRLGQYDKAIEQLQFAIEQRFDEAKALSNLGLVRYTNWKQQGGLPETRTVELHQARLDLESALRIDPDLLPAYINLANVLEALGAEREAIQSLTEALARMGGRIESGNAYLAYLQRGNLYRKQYNYQAALEDYRAAIRLSSNDVEAYLNLGAVLQQLGEAEKSTHAFHDALHAVEQATPNDAEAYYKLGVALQQLNQSEPAIQSFREAIRVNPSHAPANQRLGDALAVSGNLADAEKHYSVALRLSRQTNDQRGEAQAHMGLGLLYRRADRRPAARRELQQALRLAEESVYALASYELGRIELEDQRFDAAITLLNKSAALCDVLNDTRAGVRASLYLGRAHLLRSDRKMAIEVLQEAQQQLAAVFDPLNPNDDQLQRELDGELTRATAAPAAEPITATGNGAPLQA